MFGGAAVATAALLAACGERVAPREASAAATTDEERLEELSSLGYLSHVSRDERRKARGAVVFDRQRSSPGVTVYGNRNGKPEAFFFDREGERVGSIVFHPSRGDSLLWMETTGDGQLLASGRGYLLKSAWSGETLWEAPRWNYHHGFAQASDGTIYAMANLRREIDVDGKLVPIVDDHVLELSPAGELRRAISMLDLLGRDAISPELLAILAAGDGRPQRAEVESDFAVDHAGDVFHLNSIAVVDRDLAIARRGDLVLSFRSLDLVLILDSVAATVRWRSLAGQVELDRQHFPVLLANGNLLIFDNGWRRGYSRLVELDPRDDRIVWSFETRPRKELFTRRGGMAQPLPNGNLLVTVSDSGRVLEITRDGDVVWDFWNPIFSRPNPDAGRRRHTIYRAWRWDVTDLDAPDVPAEIRAAATR